MPTRDDFRKLHARYLSDAELLYQSERYDSAYYLAGYSVECLLKAIICKNIQPNEFPPKNTNSTHYIHSIEHLVKTAGLDKELEFDRDRSDKLKNSYLLLKDWDPAELRYNSGPIQRTQIEDFLEAIKDQEGFVSWLSKRL